MRMRIAGSLLLIVVATAFVGCGDDGGTVAAPDVVGFVGPVAYAVGESGAPVAPVLVRRTGSGVGAVTVSVVPSAGSATAGTPPLAPPADFDGSAIVVAWADGDLADKTVVVPVLNDGIVELDETFGLALVSPTGGATLGPLASATLTIQDDDVSGAIEFTAGAFSYGENGVALVPIVVRRVGGSAGAVDVVLTTLDGTANSLPASPVEPVDYAPSATTVSFADGDAVDKTVLLGGVVQDALPEIDETILLTLSAPTGGASLGAQTSAVLSFVDDDAVLTIPDPSPSADRQFGSDVVAAGGRIVVGVPRADLPGTADAGLLSVRDPATGVQSATIPNPLAGNINGFFGARLAAKGSKVLATASGAGGSLLAVDALNGAYTGFFNPNISIGPPMVPAFIVDRVALGLASYVGPGSSSPLGLVQVFDESSQVLLQSLTFSLQEQFGAELASDGPRLYVGSPGAGSFASANVGIVRAFDGDPLALDLAVQNPFPTTGDGFGTGIAVNGGVLAVGAPGDSTSAAGAGTVYLFDALDGSLLATVPPPTPVVSGGFGSKIAAVRDRFAIRHAAGGVSGSGLVVVVDLAGNVVQTIANPTPQASSGFGASMAEFDGALIVGAPLHNVGAVADAGIAYVFKID
jgi:hypothetical protein